MSGYDLMKQIDNGFGEDFAEEMRRRELTELRYAIASLVMEHSDFEAAIDSKLIYMRKIEEYIKGA